MSGAAERSPGGFVLKSKFKPTGDQPEAIAVAAAAESVTSELAEHVRVVAWNGSRFMTSSGRPILRANSSAVIRCGTDIPSPMKRNTYLGPSANAEAAMAARATSNAFFMSAFTWT